jgi:hypothetical protein
MGLGLYRQPDLNTIFSTTSPFTLTFDGKTGGSLEKCVYLRNDDTTKWYSSIQVEVVDNSGNDITDGTRLGWEWRLKESNLPLMIDEWDEITPGNTLSIVSSLGSSIKTDTVTFLPIWIRVMIPGNQRIQVIDNVVFRIMATESLI